MFVVALMLLAETASVAVPAQLPAKPLAEPDPKHMSAKEIRQFNEPLSRDHPYFIRCRVEPVTGSLAAVTRSCRTNAQWAQADRQGNDNARDTYQAMQGKAMNGN